MDSYDIGKMSYFFLAKLKRKLLEDNLDANFKFITYFFYTSIIYFFSNSITSKYGHINVHGKPIFSDVTKH